MKERLNLSRWALEHIPLVRYLIVALLIGGVLSYMRLGQDEDPPFTFRLMVVQSRWPGATALQMAEQVTDKLEKKLQETPYIDRIRSYSKAGESVIFLQLRESTSPSDVAASWYQVRKKIGDIRQTLPAGVMGPFFNDEFGDTYGSIYALSGDGFTYSELKSLAEQIRQNFLRIPSVSKVELFGVQDEKIYIELSQKKFAALGIPLDAVVAQLGSQNAIDPSGTLVTPEENVNLRVSGDLKSISDIENFRMRIGGMAIRLGDFATVTRGFQSPAQPKMRFNGKEVIGLGISMEKGGDVTQLGVDLAKAAETVRAALPVGVTLGQVANQPEAVKFSVREFIRSLSEAIIIVLVTSFIALGFHRKPFRIDSRPGLVVALSIPLVLAVTFLVMRVCGIDLHKISLGALIIALGLLVDDAIIAVEMMARKMEEGLSRFDAATFAYTSTAIPMLTGTLITVAGFLPIGLAKSNAGQYTFSMFAVNAIALLVSWVVAVVFTPYIGYVLLKYKAKASAEHESFEGQFYTRFRQLVVQCVEWKKTTVALTLASFIIGLVGFKFIERQFFPDSSRRELMVEMRMPEGATVSAMEAQVKRFEQFVASQPDVESVTSYVGSGSPRFYLTLEQIFPQENVGQIVVLPKTIEAREILRKKILEEFTRNFAEVRGRVKLLPSGPAVSYPVQFRVTGPTIDGVRSIADSVKEAVYKNPNTVNANDNWNEDVKTLHIDVDQDKLRSLGINSQSVMRTVNTLVTGTAVGQYRDREKLINIVVRQPTEERAQLSALNQANIQVAGARSIPLSQVAHFAFAWEPGVIWREGREWAINVQSDIVDGIQGPTVSSQILPDIENIRATLPAGYAIELAGPAADSGKAQKSIAANIPLVIFIIFTLLMLQLKSFTRSLLVFMTGPLGIAGAAAALLILQRSFGFVAQLGVIALFGMIIRNSVILIDQIEKDIASGMDPFNAVIEAAVRRSRPIILTAAAAVLAMIPLSRSIFWGPMAVAIMGGLIVATALTLLFLPAMYALCFKVKKEDGLSVIDKRIRA